MIGRLSNNFSNDNITTLISWVALVLFLCSEVEVCSFFLFFGCIFNEKMRFQRIHSTIFKSVSPEHSGREGGIEREFKWDTVKL